jgi:hypothetical protein
VLCTLIYVFCVISRINRDYLLKHFCLVGRYGGDLVCYSQVLRVLYTVEPGYNDIGLYDTSSIASDILWYQVFTVSHDIILLCYNNTRL